MKHAETDMPAADAMENKAHLYSRMADDLRAQAAKLRYEADHPIPLSIPPCAIGPKS